MADSYIDFGVDVGGEVVALTQTDGIFDNLTLNYSSTDHLGVIITNGTTLIQTVLTSEQFTVDTTGSLKITLDFDEIDEYSVLAATDMVRITRTTPTSELERTFTDGSVLKASDLNTQHKQLLYGIQERGPGQITLDTDGKLDAAAGLVGGVATQIKNVALPVNDDEVVTKEYVDNLQIYGTAFGATDPQYWAFTTGDDEVGSDRVYTLASPVPSSEVDNMYLVEVGGVIQSPATYVVSVSGENYTLTLVGGADPAIPDGVAIAVRNFGASRNVVSQPYVNALDTTVALQVRRKSETTSANLQEWQDEGGSYLSRINSDGEFRVGSGALNYTGIEREMIRVGKYSQGSNAAGIQIRSRHGTNTSGSEVLLSAKNDVGNSNIGFLMSRRNLEDTSWDNMVDIRWNGDVTTAGDFFPGGKIVLTSGTGIIESNLGGEKLIKFNADGPLMQFNPSHSIQTQSDKVLVVGDLEVNAGNFVIDGGSSNGLTHATNTGSFSISSSGPTMRYLPSTLNYITTTNGSNYLRGYTKVVEGDFDVTNGNSTFSGVVEMEGDNSVPSIGGLVLSTPAYKEYHYKWDKGDIATLDKLTTTLTCPSYFSAEIIFTQHQTNSGQNNLYFKAFWNNSHHNHHLDILSGSVTNETGSQGTSNDLPSWTGEIAGIGATGAMTTKLSLSHDPDTAPNGPTAPHNSGKLVIEEDYTASGSYSFSTLEVRVYSGVLVTPTHVRTDT